MGYYTCYFLDAEWRELYPEPPETKDLLHREIERMDVFYDNNSEDNCWNSDLIKWYEHEQDMLLLSSRFPQYLFTLYGNGEETDDIWYKYFIDGRCQCAPVEFVHDEFDVNKLSRKYTEELPEKYSEEIWRDYIFKKHSPPPEEEEFPEPPSSIELDDITEMLSDALSANRSNDSTGGAV